MISHCFVKVNYKRIFPFVFGNKKFMAVIFIRTLIIFVLLVIVMRLMGKRQIGEMQPFEFIVTLIIADLACIPMADVSIPLVYGVVAVLTLFLLHQLLSFIEQTSAICKRIISGKPSVVINKNGVDLIELKRNNMGVEDLIESMRAAGYFSLDDLDYAIFESNGKLSPFENSSRADAPSSVPLLIVNEGKINAKNVKLMDEEEQTIKSFLSERGDGLKNTEILTIDGNGRSYLKSKNAVYKILSFPLKEKVKW